MGLSFGIGFGMCMGLGMALGMGFDIVCVWIEFGYDFEYRV